MPNLTKTNHRSLLNPTELRYIADKEEKKPLQNGISTSQIKQSLMNKAYDLPQTVTNFLIDVDILHDYAIYNGFDYIDNARNGEQIKASEIPILIDALYQIFFSLLKNPAIKDKQINDILIDFDSFVIDRRNTVELLKEDTKKTLEEKHKKKK